jgi:hypothetical protein
VGGPRADFTFERTLSGLWADFHLTQLNFLAKLVGDSFLPEAGDAGILAFRGLVEEHF